MRPTHWILLAGMMLTATLLAQGVRQPGGRDQQQQLWLKFEKELGLQTRYTVDMEIQVMGMTMPSKLYRVEGKTRSEMTMPFMNVHMVMLQLDENGKAANYSLSPAQKKYCLLPEEPDAAKKAARKPRFKLEETGTETYEGEPCVKRRMTVKMPEGEDHVMEMLFSPAQKNMPVKITSTVNMKGERGQPPVPFTSVVLFKNYRFGLPDASLFVIPPDYTRVNTMQELMMGGLSGLGQTPGQPAGGMKLPPEALEALRKAQAEMEKAGQ
ncbi:MAG TPA: DUF4412 domain-containing protein [Kiritimatiellia bacterium]|nr:DUF4412 domain-containing protein [Kiritimatiellia bacterium]HPS06782.1 DUF4412 domain-containing protein [Kiritimatiellia bacterium]